ncbi:MAG: hypothetical protein JWO03_2864 [Bacteroidetes bacterium]|nr:hypothetical protein [Bacteroidota bacterium]
MKWIITRGDIAKEISIRNLTEDERAHLNPDNSYDTDRLKTLFKETGTSDIDVHVLTHADYPFTAYQVCAPCIPAVIDTMPEINLFILPTPDMATLQIIEEAIAGSGNYTLQGKGSNLGTEFINIIALTGKPTGGVFDLTSLMVDTSTYIPGNTYTFRIKDTTTNFIGNELEYTVPGSAPTASISFIGLDLNSIDLHVAHKGHVPDGNWFWGVQNTDTAESVVVHTIPAGDFVVVDRETTLQNNSGTRYRLFLVNSVANPTLDVNHPSTIFTDTLASTQMTLNSVQSGVGSQAAVNITYDVTSLGDIGNSMVFVRKLDSDGNVIISEIIDQPPVPRTNYDFQCTDLIYSPAFWQLITFNDDGSVVISGSVVSPMDGSDVYGITQQTSGAGNIQLTDNGGGDLTFDFISTPGSLSVGSGVSLTGYDCELKFWHLHSDTTIDQHDGLTVNQTVNASGNVDGVYVASQHFNLSDSTSFVIARLVKVDDSGNVVIDIQFNGANVSFTLGDQYFDIQPNVIQTGSACDVGLIGVNTVTFHSDLLAGPVPTDSATHLKLPVDIGLLGILVDLDTVPEITDHFNGEFFPYIQVVVSQ